MELKEISTKVYNKYANSSKYRSFLSTEQIGKLKTLNGWHSYYLGLYDNKKLLGVTLLVAKKRHFNKYEFYAPRGPLLDYESKKVLLTFLQLLEEFAKNHQGYILRIDPYVPYKERNSEGKIVENGYNNQPIVDTILSLNYKKVPLKDEEQVSWMYLLDINTKDEDEMLKTFKASTRTTIRKAIKNNIEIIELDKKDLQEFYKIMEETGKRKDFAIRPFNYYENMYDLFKPIEGIKYLVTKLDLSKYVKTLEEDKAKHLNDLEKLKTKNNENKKNSLLTTIASLDKRINIAKEEQKKYGNIITLSGSMFIMTNPEVIYLAGGNYEEFMHYNSQYLIQWEMIKYAMEHDYKRYNFYGIPSTFDKNDKDYGIYEFKTRFNGYVEQLIGEYAKPLSKEYYLIKLIHKLKK